MSNNKSYRADAKTAFDQFQRIARAVPHLDYVQVYEDLLTVLLYASSYRQSHRDEMERIRREYKPAAMEAMEQAAMAIADLSTNFFDALGEIYECITSSSKSSALGQYFTPQPISKLLAATLDLQDTAARSLTLADNAGCGSGRNILAMAELVAEHRWRHFFFGVDLDRICAKIATLNCVFNSIPAWILHANGLSGETYGGYEVRLIWGEIEGVAGWTPHVKQFTPEEVKQVEKWHKNSFKGLDAANAARVAELEKQRADWQERRNALRENFRLMMEALGIDTPEATRQPEPEPVQIVEPTPVLPPTIDEPPNPNQQNQRQAAKRANSRHLIKHRFSSAFRLFSVWIRGESVKKC